MFMSGVWIWIFFYLACLGINLITWQCMRLSSTATMEVQQATELELPSESWSWAEVAVVLGWSFWLLMFCMGVACSCSKLCLWCHPLETHRGRRLAGDKAKERHNRGLSANDLMLASKFHWGTNTSSKSTANDTRAQGGLLHLQAGRTKRPSTRHGDASIASGGACGQKKTTCRDFRMVDEVLGKCMGIGVRAFSVNKMKGTSLVKPKFAKEKDQEKER